MTQQSVWRDAHGLEYPALTGPLDVDVAIVGGGLTGITAAYLLSGKGRRVAVLEKNRLGAVAGAPQSQAGCAVVIVDGSRNPVLAC